MYEVMTFALAWGVVSSRISEGTSRASWLNDRIMAITLGARESYRYVCVYVMDKNSNSHDKIVYKYATIFSIG